MHDQFAQLLIRQLALTDLAGEVDVFQHPIEAAVVGFQPGQRLVEIVAHVMVGMVEQRAPARLRRHVEAGPIPAFHLGDPCGLRRRFAGLALLPDDLLAALVEYIGTPLQEQHAEDVFLEFGSIHLAAQDIGGLEQVAFELGEGEGHRPGSGGLWRSDCLRQ